MKYRNMQLLISTGISVSKGEKGDVGGMGEVVSWGMGWGGRL